jgi:hypothetical protein
MTRKSFIRPLNHIKVVLSVFALMLPIFSPTVAKDSPGKSNAVKPADKQFRAVKAVATEPGGDLRSSNFGHGAAASEPFYIYGGPSGIHRTNPVYDGFAGKFENATGLPDRQDWIGVDLTEEVPVWRASTTNAGTIGAGGPGNHAVVCQHDGADYVGYGNYWDENLVFDLDVTALGINPATDTTTVRLTFDYVYDLEPGYDYFWIEAERNSGTTRIDSVTGRSYNSGSGIYEARFFDSDLAGGITFYPHDYFNGSVRLRLRVTSEGMWSDEDSLYPTSGRGAAAVDDITVEVNGGQVSFADWGHLFPTMDDHPEGDITGHDNGADTGTQGWLPTLAPFVGDFSKVLELLTDLDPCVENVSPQMTFIDDGTPPANDPLNRSTGGFLGTTWGYGPGGYVVNPTGGLAGPDFHLTNEVWSPSIEWDDPLTTEDDLEGGAFLRFDVWCHEEIYLDESAGIFYVWHVRSYPDPVTGDWTEWRDRNMLYYGGPQYFTVQQDIRDLLVDHPDSVQIALGVYEWG